MTDEVAKKWHTTARGLVWLQGYECHAYRASRDRTSINERSTCGVYRNATDVQVSRRGARNVCGRCQRNEANLPLLAG